MLARKSLTGQWQRQNGHKLADAVLIQDQVFNSKSYTNILNAWGGGKLGKG